jgi:hypothetical protein
MNGAGFAVVNMMNTTTKDGIRLVALVFKVSTTHQLNGHVVASSCSGLE